MAKRSKKTVDKKLILDYLQKHGWDLRKEIKDVYDVKFEDNPPRVVLVTLSDMEAPNITHEGVKIPVEVEAKSKIKGEDSAVVTTNEQDDVYHRSISGDAAETLHISEAQGPHSKENTNTEAYKAWVKRHSAVKIQKDE